MTKSYAIALAFGFVAAFLMGANSVMVRYLTTDLHGLQIAVFRLWIACSVIFLMLTVSGRRPNLFQLDRFNLLASAGFTLNYITFHVGLEHTSATNAMVLENTAPFFVLLFLVVAGVEKIRWYDVLATGIALLGVYFTVRHDFDAGASGNWVGDFWELGAGFSWAIFIVGSARSVKNTKTTMDRMEVLLKILLPSALVLTPSLLLYPLEATVPDMMLLVLLGVLSTAVGYYLWYEAMATVSTVTAALLAVLSVVFTFVIAYVALGEEMTSDILIGGALIVAGVILPGLLSARPKSSAGSGKLSGGDDS
ncbi:DMT family transporter [Roseibium sp. HPY-6]|uniref:DMT family transporter n=1 Tax=Roseibium sp. HPY-6 TaxID=3229852 RepID=UPI0033904291